MEDLTKEVDIYYSVKPLCTISKIVGLSFVRNQNRPRRLQSSDIIFTIILVILLFVGLCVTLTGEIHSKIPHATLQVIIVWTISIIFSYSTSITTLILNVVSHKMNFKLILSNISHVDCKLYNESLKRNIYSRRRTSIILQLIVLLLLFGTSSVCAFYFLSRITFLTLIHLIIREINVIINMVTTLQYINLVLIIKQRFVRLNYMLSGSLTTDEDSEYNETRHSYNIIMTNTGYKIENNAGYNSYRLREFRIIYSELYDILCLVNDKYGISILFHIISMLSNFIPTFYTAIFTLRDAMTNHGGTAHYVQAATVLYWCALHIFLFVWMTMCCHLTATEANKCVTQVQKLLLCHNLGYGILMELDRFSSQLQSIRVEFNISGLFTLNISFLGASVSATFTYILILIQLS
ncbi:hypothetical protein B7P43_G13508 [Cryptotermes secundus]|uniref:Gustatory receptor n=1 Tax=Cryptotermes secundus TaxID=105785 RepID=A0A2J7PYR4_9NEOP|nr:hypothetical protein B7P43_G13508 [Cryptotermes secundus]